jgi:GT2 family glycosyltransferase
MKLSVIIVNFNSRDLLSQALSSILKAAEDIDHEVIVVDNGSLDFSIPMIEGRYPGVKLIENNENLGFTKACNHGLKEAKGDYVLLINPDTITNDDTLVKTLAFMDEHPDAGGLTVRMIDSQGRFLPESKRGIPTAWVSFFKATGLYKLFPKSRLYNRYNPGWIEEFETAEVDVLSAAFMLIRRNVLNQVGLLDERFVMYGEDVDLSYRMRLAGYKNFYYPKTYIIHFKGQSVKPDWRYLYYFYGAMFIFASKYILKPAVPHVKGISTLYPPA